MLYTIISHSSLLQN